MESGDDMPSGVSINQAGYFFGRPVNHSVGSDDDLPSGVSIDPGGYFVGLPQPANQSVESDDDLPSGVSIGPGGYFVGRPQGGQPTRYNNFLRLVREKLVALSGESRRESPVPSESSKLIKVMNTVMTGSLKGVDRALLETACLEISDMVDELQANEGASIPGTANHGLGLPNITIAEKMKNIREMLEKIDWQLFGSVAGGYFVRRPTSGNNGDVRRHKPELRSDGIPHGTLRRTGRIFVDLERLVDLLLLSISSNTRQPVILPIVGLGGIGKTTLAKLVYSHTKFKDYSKSWVKNPNDGLFREQLPSGGNKVLVVLDDLQDKDGRRLLNVKRNLITDVGKNAIVIVTTCSEGAAKKICTVEPYRLHADMCFATIETTDELPAAGDTDSTLCGVLKSLKESCKSMPPDLLSCFHYSAIHLAGHSSIVKDDIIHQWIALDLINQSDNSFQSRLQLGEEYIRMLLDISFLQPAKKLASSEMEYKSGTSFTVHDVVHALARSEDDVTVLDGRNGKPSEKNPCKYALLTNFDVTPMKLSNILAEHVKALFLVDCSKLELIDSSFSFAKGLRVLNIREPSMKKLPSSICQLTQLTYLNLSGCSGLINLPEPFGNLTSILYINLSGCTGIKNLPKSFGNLINVVHVNLSGCHGLDDLPQSFCKLRNLEYLDLSFCSCHRELATALGGLTNLRHLNLSHPCYYSVKHKDHLEQLKGVWAKLRKLEYLNLSMLTNPIFCYMPEGQHGSLDCFLSIQDLSSLEHLDLSHNIFLVDLPESLGDLNKLHALHLSGCVRLEKIPRKITKMKCLKNIVLWKCHSLEYSFVVSSSTDEDGEYSSNIVQLEYVSCKDLEISCLENVRSIEEAKRIRLNQKQRKLEKLTLGWSGDYHASFVDDEALLTELLPPQNLQRFELKCYRGKSLPAWLASSMSSHLTNLVGLSMEDIPSCSILPPLFLLPNLQEVVLRKMASITKVDAGELSGGNRAALHGLRQFILDDLENLEEINTIYHSGGKEFTFPIIDELVIQNCPKAKFGTFQPTVQSLQISACDQIMSSLPKRAEAGGGGDQIELKEASTPMSSSPKRAEAGGGGDQIELEETSTPMSSKRNKAEAGGGNQIEQEDASTPMSSLPNKAEAGGAGEKASSARVTQLVVKNCKVPLCDWSLLHHLPGLLILEIWNCDNLTGSPETIEVTSSLQSLCFYQCSAMTSLPECVGDLTSLRQLTFNGCVHIKSLPQKKSKLSKLKVLRILGCPQLKNWCESEDNKNKLTHIQILYE